MVYRVYYTHYTYTSCFSTVQIENIPPALGDFFLFILSILVCMYSMVRAFGLLLFIIEI